MTYPFGNLALPVTLRYSPLVGVGDSNRGATRTIFPGGIESIQAVDSRVEYAPGEAIALTLDIRLHDKDNESDCPITEDCFLPMVRALIDWGSGGTRISAECDWLLGTTIVVPAENVQITAVYREGCCVKSCGPAFDVSVLANIGTRGSNSNPARLTEMVCITRPNEKKRIQIPQHALSFSVLPIGPEPQVIPVDVFGFGSGCRVRYNVVGPLSNLGQHNTENAFPVYNGARYLEFTNPSPEVVPFRALVVFGLAF